MAELSKSVPTKKPRIVAHVSQQTKRDAERLAAGRNRSISNLIETLLQREIEDAKRSGELKDEVDSSEDGA